MSSRQRTILTRGGFLLVGLGLAWAILAAVDRRHPSGDVPALADLKPGARPAILVEAAAIEVAKGGTEVDWGGVSRATKAALKAEPSNVRALALFGLSLQAADEPDAAKQAMTDAAARSLRAALPHLWLYNDLLQEGAYASAFYHADVVLRAQPEFSVSIFRSFGELAAKPAVARQLVAELETNPAWRTNFLRWLTRDPERVDAAAALVAELQQGASPPTNGELTLVLNQLIAVKRYDQAFFLWLRALPQDKFAALDYLPNGDFGFAITDLPFDWSFKPMPGADISVASTGQAHEALRVQFYAGRVPFRGVTKLLVLPPGRYALEGREKADSFDAKRGTVWKIVCADAPGDPLATTEPLKGTVPWQKFKVQFEVPRKEGCAAQWLRLELDARVALDTDVGGGDVWYDDFAITRQAREPIN